VEDQCDRFGWTEGPYCQDLSSLDFRDAFQHILILAKNRNPPKFAELACTVFGVGSRRRNNYFVEGALCHILPWHPKPWSLPSDDELARLEAFICTPGDTDTRLFITDDGVFYFEDVADHVEASKERWYFLAASVAIDFCEYSLTPEALVISTLVSPFVILIRLFTNKLSAKATTKANAQFAYAHTQR
jgi:hypothetical protein